MKMYYLMKGRVNNYENARKVQRAMQKSQK